MAIKPADIQGRDFLVGLRGYDKDEVREFLAQVAAEHAALQAEVEDLRSQPVSAPVVAAAAAEVRDDFENLGASVAAILRTAKESASEITGAADEAAIQAREEAERYAASLREQAEQTRAYAAEAAEEQRRAAEQALEEARAEAERIVREASERASSIEVEAEARARNAAETMIAEAQAKADAAQQHEANLRARLQEAADEVSLALLALGENAPAAPAVDLVVEEHDGDPAWS